MTPIYNTWQQELADGFSNIHELCAYLQIPTINSPILQQSSDFPLRVPREFVERMEQGNNKDPLLLQILPLQNEQFSETGYSNDPVGDIAAVSEVGVIHKYHGRVLLITTGGCAINCRYCFRRNFPYTEFQLNSKKTVQAINYIKTNKDITEVILSGGDPLLLSDKKFFSLIHQLEEIKHLKRIRIHTRIPIVLPSRISIEFSNKLASIKKACIFIVHANHQNELNENVKKALKKIKMANITLLNQSVLLKNINDNADQLCALSEQLFTFGALPYYLHLLDKANGTRHFDVSESTAIKLMDQVKSQLPGYLVPKLVREQPGAANKIIIT